MQNYASTFNKLYTFSVWSLLGRCHPTEAVQMRAGIWSFKTEGQRNVMNSSSKAKARRQSRDSCLKGTLGLGFVLLLLQK